MREDLVEQVSEIATAEQKFDYLLIESTGISEPVPVAQTFCHSLEELEHLAQREEEHSHVAKEEQEPKNETEYKYQRALADKEQKDKQLAVRAIELQRMCRLDTMVTVADAPLIVEALCGTNEVQGGTTLATSGLTKAEVQRDQASTNGQQRECRQDRRRSHAGPARIRQHDHLEQGGHVAENARGSESEAAGRGTCEEAKSLGTARVDDLRSS